MKIILGSSSHVRQMILREMGIDFEIVTPDIDEKAIRSTDPRELVRLLGNAKADAVVAKVHESACIITSDHVVTCNGEILEKPENEEQLRSWFKLYEQFPIIAFTSVVVTNTEAHTRVCEVTTAEAQCFPMPEEVFEQFIATCDPWTSAGGLRIQNPIQKPYISYVHGGIDVFMGMPKSVTLRLLDDAKI